MKPSVFRVAKKTLLISILLITFFLSIKQVVPFKSIDETMISGFVWNLYQDPFPLNLYPPFFLYINFLLSLLYKGLFIFLGIVSTSWQFMSTVGLHFTVEAGRILNAVFGVLLVYLVYKTGKEFYDQNVAFFAALLMAFNQLIILHAHIFKSDVLVSLLITLSLYLLLKFSQAGKIKFILASTFTYGLAVATKYNVYIFALVIVLALVLYRKSLEKKLSLVLISLPLAAAAGFFLGAPNWLIHPLGNLKLFLEKYGFGSQSVWGPYRIYTAPQIYLKFLENMIKEFGWILLLVFLAGLILSVVSGNKRDILFGFFILIYVFFFGFMGFYGDRFSLPLYPAMIIIMGKTIFLDIKQIFRNRRKIWYVLMILIWIFTAGFSLAKIAHNYSLFNQLKTKSKNDWAKDYRIQHGIKTDKYRVAFQHLTPWITDGIKLTAEFKVRRYWHSNRVPHFIQANHIRYLQFSKKKITRKIDLSKYKPFYLIQKQKFQPWDIDFIFLYRISEELAQIPNFQSPLLMRLPRTYYQNEHTSYFPLQVYEKNPAFGKTIQGRFFHYLYSKEKINKLNLILFSLNASLDLSVEINNIERSIKQKSQSPINLIEIGNIKPKKFHKDYVYYIEIKTNPKFKPYYFVYSPFFCGMQKSIQKSKIFAPKTIDKTIPELFSNSQIPGWMKSYYRTTGLDLSLQTFIQTAEIFNDAGYPQKNFHIDFFPISKGIYKLHIRQHIMPNQLLSESRCTLKYRLYTPAGTLKKSFSLSREFESIQIEINDPINFIEMFVKDLPENNFFVKRITLVPDYLEMIRADMVD